MLGFFVNEYKALLDACVLAPMPACDSLLLLAQEGFFLPKWSLGILDEVARFLRQRGKSEENIQHRLINMAEAFEDACICGHEPLIELMNTPDPDDRHVIAAAVYGRVDVIVTNNLKDFPPTSVQPYGIAVQSLGEFPVHQYHLDPDLFINVLRKQVEMRKGITYARLAESLGKQAPELAKLVQG